MYKHSDVNFGPNLSSTNHAIMRAIFHLERSSCTSNLNASAIIQVFKVVIH